MVLKITGSQQHWMPMSRIPGCKRGNSSWSSTFKTSSKGNLKHCYSQGPEGLPHSDRINEKAFIAYLKKYSVSFFILLYTLQLKWPVYHISLYASVIEDNFWVFCFWAKSISKQLGKKWSLQTLQFSRGGIFTRFILSSQAFVQWPTGTGDNSLLASIFWVIVATKDMAA